MPGAEKLTGRILEDARRQAAENIERAEKEAAEIIEAAQREGAARREALLANAAREAGERKRRIASMAELEDRKLRLGTKQQLIEEAFNKSLEALNQLPLDTYTGLLADMIAYTAVTGDEAVILSPHDKKRLGAEFIKKVNEKLREKGKTGALSLSEETREMGGGFVLKKGNIEINNSFEAILKMRRDELEAEVVKALF